MMGTGRKPRSHGCTHQEMEKCPLAKEMKEQSLQLSTLKGGSALSASVSQSRLKSPIYIKMPFQACFNFTFPLSSPSTLRPHLAAPLCLQHPVRWQGPSRLPEPKERERKEKALN